MDWLGGGDTIVSDSFLRASDDVFAMQGNWDGYKDEEIVRPGHDVNNITIEHSVLSTSISNIVRAGWPRKTFNSKGFTLRDSDILHGGIGACGQTFGVLGFWGANGAGGDHSDFNFENLFLDNWYSLAATGAGRAGCAWSDVPQYLGAGSAAAGRVDDHRQCDGRDSRQCEVWAEPRGRKCRRSADGFGRRAGGGVCCSAWAGRGISPWTRRSLRRARR